MFLSQEIDHKMKLTKQFFEHTNKPGRWLAYKLRKIQTDKKILKLHTPDGSYSSNIDRIKELPFEY